MAPPPGSLDVILADDDELGRLNREHMGHEGPTDVLSFPLLAPGAFPPHPGEDARLHAQPAALPIERSFALPPGRMTHLGDIVVSVERAVAQIGRAHV